MISATRQAGLGAGIDEPITLTTGEGTFYYHTNNLYNVRAITGESGEVVENHVASVQSGSGQLK
ncbi:MAG: hypothetical protein KGZ25_14450 [Planctomycetes bacterium]|nr:hypothetical protein [Planctomycetota bacterium]